MEMNTFLHEHPLILKDKRKQSEWCSGCEETITPGEAVYECGKCEDFFLHKIRCSELPREIIHPSHDAHSLILLPKAPYFGGGFGCDKCGKYFRGFTYHCSLCEFDLDISCALRVRGKETNYFLHEHPLILKDKRKHRELCRGCEESIRPWEPAYECGECEDFFFHKIRCSELPKEMKHPSHDAHSLILLPKAPYFSGGFGCDKCGEYFSGFTYHCSLCEFDLDISCAIPVIKMEMNDFHHKHPLILKDKRKHYKRCSGCEERITPWEPAYECGECKDYIVHKRCEELPREIKHPKHEAHSLILLRIPPYPGKGFKCHECGESLRGLTYHCSLCEFNMDISCAIRWIEKEMNHNFLHKHPLILKDILKDYKSCSGCEERITPWEPAYECGECEEEFFLHKRCGELPREIIKHPKHDAHSLILLPTPPYSGRRFRCDECGESFNGFTYHCSLCKFYLDISCAVWLRGTEIRHFSHDHPLILNRMPEAKFGSRIQCRGCYESISGREIAFRCGECEHGYHLHRECAQLPTEIMHSRHYKHSLILQPNPDMITCNGCITSVLGFTYYCSHCEFALHPACARKDNYIICASDDSDNHAILSHKGHQQHSLALQPREALFLCDACGLEKKDHFYTCLSCPFMLHRSCAWLPETGISKGHECDLTLAYVFPSDYKNLECLCDICDQLILPQYWVYYCVKCEYFVHLDCMTTETQQIEVNSDDDDLFDDASFENKLLKVLLYDDLLRLPGIDISKEIIAHFLLRKNGLAQIKSEIEHFGHKQHPLILSRDQLPKNHDIEEDGEILCNGCIEPISKAPCYSCAECGYFLHLSCAKLPKRLLHSSHDHPLTLSCHQKFFYTFECIKCKEYSNGFYFKCEDCSNFYLDVKCAAIPTIIEHESHNHPLFQFEDRAKTCNACGSEILLLGLGCESCKFYLHVKCAMLPRNIRHRWDPHSLPLRFHKHRSNILFCDICEEKMHPKLWRYNCFRCTNSFHTDCVPRLEYPKVKFGGILKVSSHRHPLKFVQHRRVRDECNHCSKKFDWKMLFECEDCKFSICLECIRKMT